MTEPIGRDLWKAKRMSCTCGYEIRNTEKVFEEKKEIKT
jgi:hypothetical protein